MSIDLAEAYRLVFADIAAASEAYAPNAGPRLLSCSTQMKKVREEVDELSRAFKQYRIDGSLFEVPEESSDVIIATTRLLSIFGGGEIGDDIRAKCEEIRQRARERGE